MTKNQIGSVTFNDAVTAGVVALNSGTVTIGSTGSLTSSSLSVANVTTLNVIGGLGNTVLQADGTINFSQTSAANVILNALNGAGTVNFGSNTTLTLSGGAFSGSINGGGNLTINSLTGQTFTSAGLNYTGSTKILNGGLIPTTSLAAGSDIQVGDTSGSASASFLTGGAITVARNIVVAAGNTGTETIGGSTADVFNNRRKQSALNNTNSATLFAAGAGGHHYLHRQCQRPGLCDASGAWHEYLLVALRTPM